MTEVGYVSPRNVALFTDLYELTMMHGYRAEGHDPVATFSLYFRDLPATRGYAIAAGLDSVLRYIEDIDFGDTACEYLVENGFDEEFVEWLSEFSFTGTIDALPEGTPVFPNEPLLEVTAPISEAQLLETMVVNQVGYQTLIATKAARMRDVVDRVGADQTLVDFGSRRAHGVDAGLKAARAAYIGGFTGTSNVAAGEQYGIPIFGTMAHSWVQSFETERAAFESFIDVYGSESVLLVDTYDTVAGTHLGVTVAREKEVDIRGVRLDSGDLASLSRTVHESYPDLGVFVSSGMDEFKIQRFLENDGFATGFGPGTSLTTSADAPTLDCVYKLVEVDGQPSMKLSPGKVTYPGAKRVVRHEQDDEFVGDTVTVRGDVEQGRNILERVMENGTVISPTSSLEEIRERTLENLSKLPIEVRDVHEPSEYPVAVSSALDAMLNETSDRLSRR